MPQVRTSQARSTLLAFGLCLSASLPHPAKAEQADVELLFASIRDAVRDFEGRDRPVQSLLDRGWEYIDRSDASTRDALAEIAYLAAWPFPEEEYPTQEDAWAWSKARFKLDCVDPGYIPSICNQVYRLEAVPDTVMHLNHHTMDLAPGVTVKISTGLALDVTSFSPDEHLVYDLSRIGDRTSDLIRVIDFSDRQQVPVAVTMRPVHKWPTDPLAEIGRTARIKTILSRIPFEFRAKTSTDLLDLPNMAAGPVDGRETLQ
ncbi:hypothetical protein ACOXXX_13870 [Thalassococcus sp. BH17M4-6]|uniref:hypothetical protein n=1 Tax=Thalassococcus sp. BH17M4-6 TaxID=3413148 RepID=UPI003BE412A4